MLRSIRIIVELGLVVLLLSLGWEKPFKSRFDSVAHVQGGASLSAPLFDSEAHQPQVAAAPPAPPAASPHGAWMWDKNRVSPLDRGPYNREYNVIRPAGSYYHNDYAEEVDDRGNRYWTDQYGRRQYY